MSGDEHSYQVQVTWTGNTGTGTNSYRAYGRDHVIAAPGKPSILGSADPAFRGDPARWNPEEMLVASLAACHQLWYLHLCASNGIAVLAYRDGSIGTMREEAGGSGRFTRVTLRPHVTIRAEDDPALAARLHAEAHAACFIANSVAFPVDHAPTIVRDGDA